MSSAAHPYSALPDHCFWSRAHGTGQPLDPMPSNSDNTADGFTRHSEFHLTRTTRIATAGSCFAQHIARYLRKGGFSVLDGEPSHPVIAPEIAARHGYGVFSARYGNIYTARQLLQLMQRATGDFCPVEDRWIGDGAQLIDPFRPTLQPGGFSDAATFEADRSRHFSAVRDVMRRADVLIFTLGLTEAWRAREDGAVYPLAPGVAGGKFDPDRHEFVNFSVEDTVADVNEFLKLVRLENPALRVILTVSPVPLAATARADAHVVAATGYSKAVLRVAAEQLAQGDAGITYFPSYEIITAASVRGRYFGADFRSVEQVGVRHVMEVFSRHFTPEIAEQSGADTTGQQTKRPGDLALIAARRVERALDVICDEQQLDEVAT